MSQPPTNPKINTNTNSNSHDIFATTNIISNSKYIDLFAGTLGSLASLFVVWPSEVIKYQRQYDTLNCEPGSLYRRSYFKIVKDLFPFGYYKGVTPALITVAPRNAMPLVLYERVKSTVNEKIDPKHSFLTSVITGSILSLTNSVVCVPWVNLSVRKILLTSHIPPPHTTPFSHTKPPSRVTPTLPFKGLYTGFTGCCVNDFIRIGLKFMIYSEVLNTVQKFRGYTTTSFNLYPHPQKDRIVNSAISGGISSALIAVATNPLDTCITYQQTQFHNHLDTTVKGQKPISLSQSLIYILHRNGYTQGIKDLYSGFILRSLRGIPGGFVMFGVYEFVKSILKTTP